MASAKPELKTDPKYDHYDFPTTSPREQIGHPGFTTPEQDAQVFQLRMKLESAGYTERLDTLTLVRTQRAGKSDYSSTDMPNSYDFCERESSMWPSQRRCTSQQLGTYSIKLII